MLKLELLEKFLLSLAPPVAHTPIHNAFIEITNEPVSAMGRGFHILKDAMAEEGTAVSAAAVNGILLGITLAHHVTPGNDLARMITEYLDQKQKGKGENVVDFSQARAGKKT